MEIVFVILKIIFIQENGKKVISSMETDCEVINENIIFRNIEKLDTEALWNMMNQLDGGVL